MAKSIQEPKKIVSGKKLVAHSLIYTMGSLLINGGNFILIPIYARHLTPEDYGIWGSLTALNTILIAFLGLGANGIINRYYFEYSNNLEWKQFFSTISKFILAIGFLLAATMTTYGKPVLDTIFKSVRFDPYIKLAIWIAYLNIFPIIALSLFQAKQKALTYRSYTTLAFLLLSASTTTGVILLSEGVLGILYGTLLSSLVMAIIYTPYILREGTGLVKKNHLKTALSFGLPMTLYAVTGSITEIASRYFVGQLSTLSDLGTFNLAQQYSSALVILATATSMAWTPIFFKNAGKPNSKENFGNFGLTYITAITTAALFLSINAPIFLEYIPSKYSDANTIIPILLISYIFGAGIWILTITPILYAKKTRTLPWLTALSGIVCILLSVTLIPKYGIVGAAQAQLAAYVTLIAASYHVAQRAHYVAYPLKKIAAVISLAIAFFLIRANLPQTGGASQIAINTAILSIFIASLWALRLVTPNSIITSIKDL